MKKSLVFAMAMALGVSATAFAANPFSDLPAGHWAYGAVAKLAAAGVVDGYPDGTFKGDKTMTRYEMAQIVAKALAKGAIGADDKLVSEFADELDNLGVRVAKLEKNADAVKITGNIRTHYMDNSGSLHKKGDSKKLNDNYASQTRSRLWFTGEVNDNWHYVGMLENNQDWIGGKNESGDGSTTFQRAFLTGNIGIVDLKLGRDNNIYAEGNVWDHRTDAVSAKVKSGATYFAAAYGKLAQKDDGSYTHIDANGQQVDGSYGDKYFIGTIGGDLGNLNLEANYMKADDVKVLDRLQGDDKIWTAAANYKAGDWKFGAMYLHGDNDYVDDKGGDQDGWVGTVAYKGASSAKAGTWGLYAKYYDQGSSTYIHHTMNGSADAFDYDGFKGYMVGGNLTVAKNMVASVEWYDLKSKGDDLQGHAKTLWSQMVVTF